MRDHTGYYRTTSAPTPPSDAGTSEREKGHKLSCSWLCFPNGYYPCDCDRAAAPAAEGPRHEPCEWCKGSEETRRECAKTCSHVFAAALPGAEAGTPKGEPGTAERTRWMVETDAGRADTIERCKYASDGPSHLIAAFARHCAALTSEVRALREDAERYRFVKPHLSIDDLGAGGDFDPAEYAIVLRDDCIPLKGIPLGNVDKAIDAARLASPSPTGAP